MADQTDPAWVEFVQAHGQIIGYDYGEYFMPVDGRNPRAIRIYEEFCARFGHAPGIPVYRPASNGADHA